MSKDKDSMPMLREPKYHVLDVAAYCIQNEELNNFKLQKVLYYIQAAFLVERNQPCFWGRIERAEFGPVIPTIGNLYSMLGSDIISLNEDSIVGNSSKVDEEDRELINQVCIKCRGLSGSDLSIKTHEDDPWKTTRNGDNISCMRIKDYYSNNTDKLII